MKQLKSLNKISLLLITLFFISCQKNEITEANMEYVGNWVGNNSSLEILKSGTASYDNTTEFLTINGRVKIEPTQIIINTALTKRKLKLNRPPYKEDMGAEDGIVTGVLIDKIEINDEVLIKIN